MTKIQSYAVELLAVHAVSLCACACKHIPKISCTDLIVVFVIVVVVVVVPTYPFPTHVECLNWIGNSSDYLWTAF